MRTLVLVNPAGGKLSRGEVSLAQIEEACRRAGLDAEVRTVRGAEIADQARFAAAGGVEAVVAGGGDGTVRSAADGVAGSGCALGVLPLGTFNRFASDLGIEPDLDAAIATVAAGHRLEVDVAEVNGLRFLNGAALGFAAAVAARRLEPKRRFRTRFGKALASSLAGFAALPEFPTVRLRLTVEGESLEQETSFAIASNNECALSVLGFGKRSRLDEGVLYVGVLRSSTRRGMFAALFRAIFQDLREADHFEHWRVEEAEISIARRRRRRPTRVDLYVDGELFELVSPLHFKILPKALTVLAPPPAPAATAAS